MNILWVITGILVVVILIVAGLYNKLVRNKQRVNEAFADTDVQLKRRHDLIPNLVNTVQGYSIHEKELFENVTKARTQAMSAQGPQEQSQAENMLSETLKSLFAVAENYPDLKANENFAKLQDELSDTENKIQAARRFYNGQVRDYNTAQQTFPANVIVKMFNFRTADYFEIELESEREVPKVSFK